MVKFFPLILMFCSCSFSSSSTFRYKGTEINPSVYRKNETEIQLEKERKEKDIPKKLTLLELDIKERSEVSPEAAACYLNYPPSIFFLTSRCCDKKPYHCDVQYSRYLEQKESQLNHQIDFIDAYCSDSSHRQELVCNPRYRQHLEEELDSF